MALHPHSFLYKYYKVLIGVGVLLTVAVVSTLILKPRSTPTAPPISAFSRGDTSWTLVQVSGSVVVVSVVTDGGTCIRGPEAQVVQQDYHSVVIAASVEHVNNPQPCPAIALLEKVSVRLQSPLGNRTLLGCAGPGAPPAGTDCSRVVRTP